MINRNHIKPILLTLLTCAVLTSCSKQPKTSHADYIGIDAAKENALKSANISADQVSFSSAGLDSKNGVFFYQVVFTENNTEHEYDIDALTGLVIEEKHTPQTETVSALPQETAASPQQSSAAPPETTAVQPSSKPQESSTAPTTQKIDTDTALSAALLHAGLTEQDISSSKVEIDTHHGKTIYEVEFITSNGIQYDYDLAADGSVISFDYDAESLFLQPPSPNAGIITEAQAKQTVLDRVPQAKAEQIYLDLDEDDGRLEYEGSLISGTMKYEFKIDAYSGGMIEWEAELLN